MHFQIFIIFVCSLYIVDADNFQGTQQTTNFTKPSTSQNGTLPGYLPCKDCYGWPKNPGADPRCQYGCGRVITMPPTKLPCDYCRNHTNDPECLKGCDRRRSTERVTPPTFSRVTPDLIKIDPTLPPTKSQKGSSSEPITGGSLSFFYDTEPEGQSNTYVSQFTCVYCNEKESMVYVWPIVGSILLVLVLVAFVAGYRFTKTRSNVIRSFDGTDNQAYSWQDLEKGSQSVAG